jgi:subtilisin family serine protease
MLLRALAVALLLLASLAYGQNDSPIGRIVPGRFIVTYRNGAIPANAFASTERAGARLLLRHERLGMAIVQGSSKDGDRIRRQLTIQPDVAAVVADRVVTGHALSVRAAAISARPDVLYHSQQGWAVRQVGGFGADGTDPTRPGPWNISQGRGVRIAILDSGIDSNHPDLIANLGLNLSEVDLTALPSVCDDGTPRDQQGHGTWSAGLAAGALGDGTGQIAGVAPQATLLNIKVLERLPSTPTESDPTGCNGGQAAGLLSWVIQGIEDAVANRADVISMSLGTLVDVTTGDGAGLKATFDQATHAAFNAGVVLIAAAGNDGLSLANARYLELPAGSRDVVAIVASTNPACAEDIAAGAVCASGPITMPYYSNFGATLNALAAPGGSYPAGPAADLSQPTGWILSACASGRPATLSGPPTDANHSMGCFGLGHIAYVQAMGTSASAPLAAGVAALLRGAHPTWDAVTTVAALRAMAMAVPGLGVPQVSALGLVPAQAKANPIVVEPVSR